MRLTVFVALLLGLASAAFADDDLTVLDEPDYVMMRAPKPTLICTGTRDVTFNIEGTWDLFRQSQWFYSRLGFPERVEMNEADCRHETAEIKDGGKMPPIRNRV